MNWIVLSREDELGSSRYRISGEKNTHLLEILKKESNGEIRVILSGKQRGKLILESTDKEESIGFFLPEEKEETPSLFANVETILALPRPQTGKKILHLAGVYGVPRLVFTNPYAKNKEFWTSPVYNGGEKKEMESGMAQSGNIYLPKLEYNKDSNWYKDRISNPDRIYIFDRTGISYESFKETISDKLHSEKLSFCFGPESGWSESDLEIFRKQSFEIVSLGSVILRTEFAFHAFLHQTNTWLETDSSRNQKP
ncbi:ribosomal RNA small subunit methyltransferase E [Leptospira kobayashii]|uniref:Ribosomal RNA small subunit methyltransferase E n=1 Tax=Leptospira kobayashii TaxID=1917830 RepID=A0ABN6KDC9_9LEPT|nr:RsmE family RNA methyltransferase [Leptospira kobayashii]BDA78995.1 ribosomal RNA small subunit methyltransferase E [Leptospira kobayashii]